ncbi:Aldo-keto reductase [Mycena indigotica]|uniref:Aldo-keto reductase n=1 Tax=Mycena indigotica TaxID=2126181 RepID=A0A8H6SI34_9AGAR|nr:Aldo-keto reductase [Mycena indigotica]KAF7298752.1 Aldo-keto reductase [Mycena indigotica]
MPFANAKLNDGNEIPTIAFGTGSVNKGKDVSGIVTLALEAGFEHLDTAQIYGTETTMGKAIYESGLARSELYITSKYWRGDAQDALKESLEKVFGYALRSAPTHEWQLKINYLDLYLIHSPRLVSDVESVWRGFEQAKASGLTKSIGVSNFDLPQLQSLVKIARVLPSVNQISFSPYNYTQLKPLLEFSAKHKIVTAAYSSLAPITRYPGGPVDAPVAAAAKRLGISPTQVIFLWVKSKGVIVVTTSSSKAHMEEYLAVGDLPSLTEEEIAAIDAAGANGPPSSLTLKAKRLRPVQVILPSLLLAILWFANWRWFS